MLEIKLRSLKAFQTLSPLEELSLSIYIVHLIMFDSARGCFFFFTSSAVMMAQAPSGEPTCDGSHQQGQLDRACISLAHLRSDLYRHDTVMLLSKV